MPKHYQLGPSSAHRWLVCPGSLKIPAAPRTESEAATEGTLAHDYAAAKLLGKPGIYPGDELAEVAQVYVDYVAESAQEALEIIVEDTLESRAIPGLGGTPDCLMRYAAGTVEIVDLKTGVGHAVGAERNPQLLSYAVLALEKWPDTVDFLLTIVQPRTPGAAVDSWQCTAKVVKAFAVYITSAAASDKLQAGDHCKWCPALTNCPEVARHTLELAGQHFDDTEEKLVEIFYLIPAIKALIEEIPKRLLAELQKGKELEGVKAVMALSNRKWRQDDEATLRALAKKKIGKKLATVAKLKSPTQLEKEGYAEEIADLYHREEKGLTVVKETDRREGVSFKTTAEKFAEPEAITLTDLL